MSPATTQVACPHCGTANRVPSARLAEDPSCGRCGRDLLDGRVAALDEASFDAVTSRTDLPVLVDFWAPWCGPCRTMAPQFEAAARQLKGRALLVKVNSDEAPGLAARFGIRSIPSLIRLQNGREVSRNSGAVPASQVVAMAT